MGRCGFNILQVLVNWQAYISSTIFDLFVFLKWSFCFLKSQATEQNGPHSLISMGFLIEAKPSNLFWLLLPLPMLLYNTGFLYQFSLMKLACIQHFTTKKKNIMINFSFVVYTMVRIHMIYLGENFENNI